MSNKDLIHIEFSGFIAQKSRKNRNLKVKISTFSGVGLSDPLFSWGYAILSGKCCHFTINDKIPGIFESPVIYMSLEQLLVMLLVDALVCPLKRNGPKKR